MFRCGRLVPGREIAKICGGCYPHSTPSSKFVLHSIAGGMRPAGKFQRCRIMFGVSRSAACPRQWLRYACPPQLRCPASSTRTTTSNMHDRNHRARSTSGNRRPYPTAELGGVWLSAMPRGVSPPGVMDGTFLQVHLNGT